MKKTFKKIVFSLMLILTFIFTMNINTNASSNWDLKAKSESPNNLGFLVSPMGENNYTILNYHFNFSSSLDSTSFFHFDYDTYFYEEYIEYYDYAPMYLDFYFVFSYTQYKNVNGFSFRTNNYTLDLENLETRAYLIENYGYNDVYFNSTRLINNRLYHFKGYFNRLIFNYLQSSFYNKNELDFYLILNYDNYNNMKNFDNSKFNNLYAINYLQMYVSNGWTKFSCCYNYIYSYDNVFNCFNPNLVLYDNKDFYFNELDINEEDWYCPPAKYYGYGFKMGTFPLKNITLSPCFYDEDADTIYPTFTNNSLFYLLPNQFTTKFSDSIDFTQIECLGPFDYRNFNQTNISNDKKNGLWKNYSTINNGENFNSNFYWFSSQKMYMVHGGTATGGISLTWHITPTFFGWGPTSNQHFYKNSCNAFFSTDIENNAVIDLNTNNDELAKSLNLYYKSCHWWDLKGQLNNLFYYIITGLPFLNNLYLFLNNIFGISKIGFSLISFSVPLLSLVSFVLLVYVVFNKMLK